MTFDVVNTFPTDTCTTPKLDNAATTDFEVGQSAVFEGDSLGPNDGGCKLVKTRQNIDLMKRVQTIILSLLFSLLLYFRFS